VGRHPSGQARGQALSHEGRGENDEASQISDETIATLPDWAGAEHDFVHGDLSLDRIARRRGMSRTAIVLRAKKKGWVRLVGTKPLKPGPKPRPPGALMPKPAAQLRRDMVRRLLEALDKRLTLLETRMAPDAELGEAMQSAADAERDARTLSGLARLYAKLVELDDAARADTKGKPERSVTKPEATDDADRLRHDLALRLQRLNQARDA
jgi:hypothetical protein